MKVSRYLYICNGNNILILLVFRKERIMDNYGILLGKLDKFIRKYYRNRLLKGLILFVAIFLISYLIVNILEFFGHFSPIVRTVLFYLFLLANGAVLIHYIIIPLFKIRKIGKILSYEEASRIIGRHFPEISDKLLNTLQLAKLFNQSDGNVELLKASIDQKIRFLTPIPFVNAIDLKKNRKYLKFVVPPLLLIFLLLMVAPSSIIRPTQRIIYHSHVFAEEFPFQLIILNTNLQAYQQEDFTLNLKVEGEPVPDEIFVETNGTSFKMTKENTIRFSYTFKTLQKTLKFRLSAGKFKSQEYVLNVFPKPTILNFDVALSYPKYTKRNDEILENTGDLTVPEGTRATWRFYTKDVNRIEIYFSGIKYPVNESRGNVFRHDKVLMTTERYAVRALNTWVQHPDSMVFNLNVIPDVPPTISVMEQSDSNLQVRKYFQGIIKDDYGFSRLVCHYIVIRSADTSKKEYHDANISFDKSINQQTFYYSLDVSSIIRDPGDEIDYYFEVCDNDGIHGPKCAQSNTFRYRAPTLEEIENLTKKTENNITGNLKNALKDAQEIQKEMEELTRKMVEKKDLNWQDKKQIKNLIDREKEIRDRLENIQKQNESKTDLEEQYKNPDPEFMDKQRKLTELFNQVMDEDMKKMIQEMKDLLDKVDKNQVSQMMEKMKMSNKDLEKQLDRSLELFKQVEFQKNLAETIDKLNQLSEKQNKLGEKTESEKNDLKSKMDEQKNIQNEFKNIKKDINELEKKNKDLDQPNNFPNTDAQQKEIENQLNDSQESLENSNRKSASESQKKASKSMKQLAEKLQNMQEEMENDQNAEDEENLRMILEDLVRISFDQEDLMGQTKSISRNDPRYLSLIKKQNELQNNLSVVEDSLTKVARRQVMIKPYIMREIGTINQNVEDAVKAMNDRVIGSAATKQQYVMTSVNNLALMLSEALKQMEQQSQNQSQCHKQGKSSCNNGKMGGKKMSIKSLRQLQQDLNSKLQNLKKNMEMQKSGQSKDGKQGQKSMSEQLARMAAEQEAIRNEMRKYADQLNEEGLKGQTNELNDAMSKMEKTEKDIVNKRITEETVRRQQEILTRLLESEKAELQREQEEKRESNEAKNQKISNPSLDFKYNNRKNSSPDLLKTVQPAYNYFYKNKINQYFLKIGL
ncbi:MAG: hypothetical protein Q8867_02560 [Bacteroidota bacterium]|nr:hypothetical protein [Bacteroidota bacterium]